jgi:diacylglycerol kinase (ATP)
MKNKPFYKRLGFAITGIAEGWRLEKSFRMHVTFAILAVVALSLLRPAPIWWAVVILTAGLVLAVELINGALEALIDHLHPELHPRIRIVKDMAAGGVLIVAVCALLVAALMVWDTLGPIA